LWAEGILAERRLLGARVSGNVGGVGRPRSRSRPLLRSQPYPAMSAPVFALASVLTPVFISATHICVHGHRHGCASSRGRDWAHVYVHVLARDRLCSRAHVHEHTLCVNIHLVFCPRPQLNAAVDLVRTAVRGTATIGPPGPRRSTFLGCHLLQSAVDTRLTGEEASNILRKNTWSASQRMEGSPHLPTGGEVEARRAMSRHSEKGISEGCRKGPPPKSRARPGARGWACT